MLLSTPPAMTQDFGRRERSYDVQHYDIRVRLDERKQSVDGVVRIRVRALGRGLDTLAFDAVGMRIEDVRFATAGAAGEERSTAAVYAYDSLMLRVCRPEPGSMEDETVLIRYSCTPQRGMYFIAPDVSFPDDPRQIWTQGQGEDNRHWFPCFDYPSDKATSEVRMTVDTALATLSNGRLVSRADNGDGTATWHWSLDRPHSSYLVMLAAGRYHRYRRVARYSLAPGFFDYIPVESWYYPGDDPRDVHRTFMDTADMLAFFAERLGVAYPWNKYAQIPVAHFLYGGMENTTATVMSDTRMVVDARAALDYDPQPLIAHELAHQWVGDLVTYIDWQNEWLNEGFATFLQQLWTRHRYGEEDFRLQRFNGIRSYMEWTDRAGRLPVVHRTSTSSANTYSKGAAVLHMLREILGEEDFWNVLRSWLEKHAFASVETEDLLLTIEEVSGRQLRWFFDQWLYRAGYPEIEIVRERLPDPLRVRVIVRQTQQVDSLCGYFRLALTVSFPHAGSTTETRIDVAGAETIDTLTLPTPDAIPVFDPSRLICGRISVDYTAGERRALLSASGGGDAVSAPWRVVLAGEALADSIAMQDSSVRSTLYAVVRDDPVPEVRKAVATGLADLVRRQPSFGTELRENFLKLLQDGSSGVRATALNGLHNFHDPALLPVFWEMLGDSSYYAEAAAMNGVLGLDSTGSRDIVRQRLQTPSREDVLALAALDWVQRYRYTELLEDVLTLAGPGHGPVLRSRAFETLIILGVPGERLLVLLERQLREPRSLLRLYAVSALRYFPHDAAQALLRRHIRDEDNPRVRSFIREHFGI
jgi:aminopeptidase N